MHSTQGRRSLVSTADISSHVVIFELHLHSLIPVTTDIISLPSQGNNKFLVARP
jgi:hypothetical protein